MVDGISYTRKELLNAFGWAVSRGDIAECKKLMPERYKYSPIECVFGKIVPTTEYDGIKFENSDYKPNQGANNEFVV